MDINKSQYLARFAGETKKKGPNGPRAELIGKFTDRLNEQRKCTKFKALTPAAVAVKVSHIKSTSDLYAFFRQCEQARHFSRYFWWALKPQS